MALGQNAGFQHTQRLSSLSVLHIDVSKPVAAELLRLILVVCLSGQIAIQQTEETDMI